MKKHASGRRYGERRRKLFNIRLTLEERELIKKIAWSNGISVGEYVRRRCLPRTQFDRFIAKHAVTEKVPFKPED